MTERLVYFAVCGHLVKIGCSARPYKRFATPPQGCPYLPIIVATLSGGFELERKLHCHLRESFSHGEWFHITPEVRRVIGMAQMGALPDDLAEAKISPVRETIKRKSNASYRIALAERRAFGYLMFDQIQAIRPQYVVDAKATYADPKVLAPSDEALAAIAMYEAELADSESPELLRRKEILARMKREREARIALAQKEKAKLLRAIKEVSV
jgi:hypothetical protein